MNRSSIAWKSAGNFNNSSNRVQVFFRRLSLAPSDFFLFPKIKIKLKGQRFDTVEEIKVETQGVLNTLNNETLPGCISNVIFLHPVAHVV
jgi:hypothetical protein